MGFRDRSTARANFGGKYGAPIVTNGGLFTVGNSHYAAARLLLGEFLALQARRTAKRAGLGLARDVASTPSNAALLPSDRGQTCSWTLSVTLVLLTSDDNGTELLFLTQNICYFASITE